MSVDFYVRQYSLLLGVVFNIPLLLGVVFDSDILAKNFKCIFKNIYKLNINKSAFSGASLLLGMVFDAFLNFRGSFRFGPFCYNFFCIFRTF